MINGFHHVALKCANIEKSLEMYKALGLKEFARWGEGERLIVMLEMANGDKIEMFANGGDEFSVNGKWQHFALSVDNVEEAYNKAIEAGFASRTAPCVIPLKTSIGDMGINIAFVKGPDGEEVEFFKQV